MACVIANAQTQIIGVYKIYDPIIIKKLHGADTLVSNDPYSDNMEFNMQQFLKDSVVDVMCGFKQPDVKGISAWAEGCSNYPRQKTTSSMSVIIFKQKGNRQVRQRVYYVKGKLLRYQIV